MNIVLLSMLIDLLKSTDYIASKYPKLATSFSKVEISEIEKTETNSDGYYIIVSSSDVSESIFITKDMLMEYQLRKTKKELSEV